MAIDITRAHKSPIEEDWFQAARRIDDAATRDGLGIAWHLDNELRKIQFRSPSFRRTMANANHLASRSLESEVDGHSARHIKLGALAGALTSFDIHSRDVLFLRDIIGATGIDVNDTSYVLDEQIESVGEQGLAVVGERTADIVSQWSRLMDRSSDQQALFCHSFGVIALGSHIIQIEFNSQFGELLQDYADFKANSPEIDAEIAAILDGSS